MQLGIIKDLYRRFPGQVAIDMGVFREPQQESLDLWTAGTLSELAFLKESKWFENWSSNFGYYRGIMTFARDKGIDVIALNPPIELQHAFGMSDADGLPPGLAEDLPPIDSSDPYQRAMIEAYCGSHEGGEGMQEAFSACSFSGKKTWPSASPSISEVSRVMRRSWSSSPGGGAT